MNKIVKRYSGLKIYYKLLPFLFLYILICLLLSHNELVGDEIRYMMYAKNLTAGFYSPPPPDYDLWMGPGYPIFITPFVLFKLPLIAIKLLNPILLYFSLIISFKSFRLYANEKSSFLFTVLLGLYFPVYEQLFYMVTECLAWFLLTLVCYSILKNYQQKTISWKMIFLAAFSLAYMSMTKVIFGYVIEVMLVLSILAFLIPKLRNTARKSILIFLFSFILCLPWLFYTYHLTHKPLYWGNSGSMSLYTMSTPFQDELGDWQTLKMLSTSPNHRSFMDSISNLSSLQKDEAYKAAAIQNIKHHPKKYFLNWMANIGRLLFSFPFSKSPQELTNFYTIVPNMFIFFVIIFSFAVCILNAKKIPQEVFLLLVLIFVYLFGSSLVSGYRRMFYITIPFWAFFIMYILSNFVYLRIKKDNQVSGMPLK